VGRSVASRAVASGTLICESLRVGAILDAVVLNVSAIERVAATDLSAEQREAGLPERWTLARFEVGDEHASRLADALAEALDEPGWYADLHTAQESFVVFARRVFRYRSDDPAGRSEAEAYASARGVPETQIDWP
jgi:hypothetical protein